MKILQIKNPKKFCYTENVLIDDEDWERVIKYKWRIINGASVRANIKDKDISLANFILNIKNPEIFVDHKDRNPFNNQKWNLRSCDCQQNNCNKGPQLNNTTGYKGVYWDKSNKKWQAQISYLRKRQHLGLFRTKEEAAKAYDIAALKYHGEFAYLNFPNERKNK